MSLSPRFMLLASTTSIHPATLNSDPTGLLCFWLLSLTHADAAARAAEAVRRRRAVLEDD